MEKKVSEYIVYKIDKPNGQSRAKEAHITLKFRPSTNNLENFDKLNGRNVLIKFTNFLILKNGKLACIVCNIGNNNKNYHITYICKGEYKKNGETNQFKPVDSNKLVEAWKSGNTRHLYDIKIDEYVIGKYGIKMC